MRYTYLIPRGFSMLKMKKLIFGTALSIIVSLGLLMILAFAVDRSGMLPGRLSGTITVLSAATAVLLASVLTARLAGERGLLHGVTLAAIYCAVYVIIGIVGFNSTLDSLTAIRISILLLCGAIGGVIGVSLQRPMRF